jgi:hypothetical protein
MPEEELILKNPYFNNILNHGLVRRPTNHCGHLHGILRKVQAIHWKHYMEY